MHVYVCVCVYCNIMIQYNRLGKQSATIHLQQKSMTFDQRSYV